MSHRASDGHGMHRSKPSFLRILAVKALLIAGVIALVVLARGYVGAGVAIVVVHVIGLVAVLAVVLWGVLTAFYRRAGGARHRGRTEGTVLRDAARYDLFIRLMTFGFESRFRRRLLAPAQLQLGESVLDVGCGTGSLAILARREVGEQGSVVGLDASEEMIARARLKAARSGLDIGFAKGTAETLPFDASQFDVVVGTLMLHHLAKRARPAFLEQAHRVLKPSGRLVLVDFGRSEGKPKATGLHRHGHVDMGSIHALLVSSGFSVESTGRLGFKGLEYVVAVPQRNAASA